MNIEFVLGLKIKYFREYIKMCTDIYILENILYFLLKKPNFKKLQILFKTYKSKKFIYYLTHKMPIKIVFANTLWIIMNCCPLNYKVRLGFLFRKILKIYNYKDAIKFYFDDQINLWQLKKYGTNETIPEKTKFYLFQMKLFLKDLFVLA